MLNVAMQLRSVYWTKMYLNDSLQFFFVIIITMVEIISVIIIFLSFLWAMLVLYI